MAGSIRIEENFLSLLFIIPFYIFLYLKKFVVFLGFWGFGVLGYSGSPDNIRAILTAIISRASACSSDRLIQFVPLFIVSFRAWLSLAVEG